MADEMRDYIDPERDEMEEKATLAVESSHISRESLAKVTAFVGLWIANNNLEVVFYPAVGDRAKMGKLVDFDYDFVLDNRHIHMHHLVALMNTWLFEKSYYYPFAVLAAAVRSWVWEEFKRQVPDEFTLPLVARPRLVYVKKRGRPRKKDGTTQTVYIKEDSRQNKFGTAWNRLTATHAWSGTLEELEKEIADYDKISNTERRTPKAENREDTGMVG